MKSLIALVLLLPSIAFAQTTATPAEQALGAKLMREINEGLTCNASVNTLQAELVAAKAKIKELEAKVPADAKQ